MNSPFKVATGTPLERLDTEVLRAVCATTKCNRLAVRIGVTVRMEVRHFRQCAPAITVLTGPIDSFQWTCRARDSNAMKCDDVRATSALHC